MKEELQAQIQKIGTGSVLFMGSGVSRRYVSLPTWESLLSHFCICGREFGYYRSAANGSLPKAASLLAADFHQMWWSDPRFEQSRAKYKGLVNVQSDPLKCEMAEYILTNTTPSTDPAIIAEVELLKTSCVDALITTNWDNFLDGIFPEFRAFVGQDQLLFSNPSMIAEIYKIHGSCSDPKTLVATEEDYANFDGRNPYLASKMISIFLEHPIIFMGYSLTDTNIGVILDSIIKCMGTAHLNQLQDRLFFVEWDATATTPTMSSKIQRLASAGSESLPLTLIKTSTFLPIFEALQDHKRQIPVRILRYCKEQLYELVRSNEPEKRLQVLPFEETDKLEDVEFVIGIGASNAISANKGYAMHSRKEVFEDYLFDRNQFDPKLLLEHTLPVVTKGGAYAPVFKYLHQAGIKTQEEFKRSGYLDGKLKYYQTDKNPYYHNLEKIKNLTLEELIKAQDDIHVLYYIPLLLDYKVDAEQALFHMRSLFNQYDNQASRTVLCKAICACDEKLYPLG